MKAGFGRVGVNPPGHAVHPDEVHGEEGHVHADEHQPEVELAESFAQHLSRELRAPIVDAGEYAEDGTAEQNVVDVGHYVIGVLLLVVGRRHSMGDAAEAADDKQGDKTNSEQHGSFKFYRPAPHGAYPVEYLHTGGYRDEHGGDGEHRVGHRSQPRGEHVVAPHRPTHDPYDDPRKHDEWIAEQGLPGEGGKHFGDNAHWRQNQDIDLGVAEYPE